MDALVFGATGFLGRSLVAELLARGQRVAAAVRTDTLTPWLLDRGGDIGGLTLVTADIRHPLTGLPEVRDVYNTAGRYAFGLDATAARATNVTGALHVLEWAATLPELRRLVHISGYRVSAATGEPDYARLGAYEASKFEGDLALRARAHQLGVPLTIANPSAVIGPGQYIGPATLIEQLWGGRLPALPGGPDTFVPIVTVDYLAQFLPEIPGSPAGEHYWVLDDTTPALPELIVTVAEHLGVPAPRGHIPVGLLRRLPRALTGADPETLSFLSTDRYPTASARALAADAGLEMPSAAVALREWADELVAARFGAAAPWLSPYGFHEVAGSRTWVIGERERPEYVLLHGLPMNADLWESLAAQLPGPVLAADLPGQGRSSAAPSVDAWLVDLLGPVRTRPVLIAHSAACAPALRFAAEHPDRLGGLVLISPAFLQKPAGWLTRWSAPMLRRLSAERLARTLEIPGGEEVRSAAADLGRPGVARRVLAALRADIADRSRSRALLDRVRVPVRIITGSLDPLTATVDHPVIEIPGAGHYPQLTHPAEVATQVISAVAIA
ncbi:alpha/beta fold hydrolase [Nocardia acidivorans]|uniref:alpha/beta fold hydrolase n=1 Tax=Nocardia acidivorans TaxID=404580 RepID=UPI000831F19A|nr:alpha/beta fold hydrolase [Nocardia acidivorans]